MNCTAICGDCKAPGYARPAGLKSKHKLCITSAVGDAEAKANAAADSLIKGFSATDVGAEARGGKKLMNKLVNLIVEILTVMRNY